MSDSEPAVLVVDDDAPIREALRHHLRGAGYRPVVAEDGAAGWEILERADSGAFQAVLLDRVMPRMDGMELLARIRAREELGALPVILQTGKTRPEEVREGIEAGAYYYLTKPWDKKTLLAIVHAAVNDHREQQTLRRKVRSAVESFSLMVRGVYEYRTVDEAQTLATLLAGCCADPEKVVLGLSELLTNAVEHGNLGIGYEEKSRLLEENAWRAEVRRRLELPEFAARVVRVEVERRTGEVRYTIRDQGDGFDWRGYLEFHPERAFDLHGRGIALSCRSFDRVEFQGKGNEVVAITPQGAGPPLRSRE